MCLEMLPSSELLGKMGDSFLLLAFCCNGINFMYTYYTACMYVQMARYKCQWFRISRRIEQVLCYNIRLILI